jgi:hypothetical protein
MKYPGYIQRFAPQATCLLSWDARHFHQKLSVPALTLEERHEKGARWEIVVQTRSIPSGRTVPSRISRVRSFAGRAILNWRFAILSLLLESD